jgi:hypothetical protein
MNMMLMILRDSLSVFGRYLVLVYPLLLLILVLNLIMSTAGVPSLDMRWLMLVGVMALIYYAFMAGWYRMIYGAIRLELLTQQKPPEPGAVVNPFANQLAVFREFLPGVGEFFLSFAAGYLIQILVFCLLGGLTYLTLDSITGISPGLEALFTGTALKGVAHGKEEAALREVLMSIPSVEIWMITLLLFIFGIFHFITILWAPFVAGWRFGVLKAYKASLQQFVRFPTLFLAAGLLYLIISMGFQLLAAIPFLGPLLAFFAETFFTILFFMMAIKTAGPPPLVLDAVSPSEPPGKPSENNHS